MPKAPALPDDAIEQHRRALQHAVFLGEKFLELVNHQQRARHRFLAAGPFVAGHVLHAELPEQITAPTQFLVGAHAQAERAVALDGNHLRVRQPAVGVAFELDAFLNLVN